MDSSIPRVSPRQALVALAPDVTDTRLQALAAGLGVAPAALRAAALLDTIATLGRVDGATLAVAAVTASDAGALAALLPAGVDVLAPPPQTAPGDRLPWTLRDRLDHRFDRAVAIAGDALLMPSRLAATALGALAAADLVVGSTPGGDLYLVGLRDASALDLLRPLPDGSAVDARTLLDRARRAALVARRMETRSRLVSLAGPEAVRAALADAPALAARLTGLLAAPGA